MLSSTIELMRIRGSIPSRVADDRADNDAGAASLPRVAAGSTRSVAAYDAYLRGRAQYDLSADETSERAALAQFDAAIAADPGYAAAHAARARSLTAIANQYGVWQERERDGQKFMGVARSHFVIDENGKVIDVQYNVAPDASPELSINML